MNKNNNKMLKKALCLIFAFLFSINSMAAVVSDNDGAAFVTKAEFDALKQDFADQVVNYNTSIDSKIDGAIAAYLAGKRMSKKEVVKLDNTFNWTFPIININGINDWNNIYSKYYSYEVPDYQTIYMVTRSSTGGCTIDALGWNSTAILSSNHKQTGGQAVSFCKQWVVTKKVYGEMIELSDQSINRTLGTTNLTCYKLKNVGKGRHRIERFQHAAQTNAGHTQQTTNTPYYGYAGVLGMNVSGGWGTGNQMTTANYTNWEPGWWTRTGGTGAFSSLGWGMQTANAYVLPTDGMNLDNARAWAQTYTGKNMTYAHDQPRIKAQADNPDLVLSIDWENDNNNHRQYAYTGDKDAPATSTYGWSFQFQKPSSATAAFEGFTMTYSNDIAMVNVSDNKIWGFHSWAPAWYWRYSAYGNLTSNPSTTEFSKHPAKQIYYYDSLNNIHFLDEGLFLFNMPGTPESVEFDAKWSVLDPTITSEQKIGLRISDKPFDADHDYNKDLNYQVDGGALGNNQQIVCGSTKKIKVQCDEHVKQLYMNWWPNIGGTYVGLSELSDFTVALEQ